MLIYSLLNWQDVEKTLFLTEKTQTIYAYAYADRVYIGTAEEIYSELQKEGLTTQASDCYFFMGDYTIPRDNGGFLTTMQIKCIN